MSSIASTSDRADLSHAVRGFACGGFAAAISKTTVAPMDRVKLILQLQQHTTVKHKMTIASNQLPYSGILDCTRRLCAEQGVLSLWRGNCATVARCFPSHAMNFVLRDYYRLLFLKDVDRKKNYGRFVFGNICAGGAGGVTSLCFLYPLDVARTRLAVETNKDGTSKFRGLTHCLKAITRAEGIAGAYRGFVVSLQFVAISRSVFFGMFDTIRGTITDDPKKLSFVSVWLIAQACVSLSSFACYPMDTVRRKLMMQSGKADKLYAGSLDCFLKTYKNDGIPAFFRGAVSNSLKCTGGALMVAVYYEALKYF